MPRLPDISFCMIVRNGAVTLPACLKSVAPVVDELIVVDTGSSDDSRAVARSFGATIVSIGWRGDFAAARNEYLRAARCSWVLSLDADEVLEPVEKPVLQEMLRAHANAAFAFTIRNYFSRDDRGTAPSYFAEEILPGVGCTITRTVRLLPRRRGVEYRYPVHESLLPALREQGIPVRRCPIPIHHMGYLYGRSEAGVKAKAYRELGLKKIAQYPRYFLGHFELGHILLFEGELDEARRRFEECLRLNSRYARAYYYLALTHVRAGRNDEAMRQLQRGLRWSPRHPGMRDLWRTLHHPAASAPAVAAMQSRAHGPAEDPEG